MPAQLAVLDGAAARRWAASATAALAEAREELDALNVYPVPDGDTGTNLHLTLAQGLHDLEALDAAPLDAASLDRVSAVFARGCLIGARGNSGIITAQLLRGWADTLAGCREAGPDAVRDALSRADDQAWAAVAEPVEGTILSVSRAAAEAACATDGDLLEVVTAVVDAAVTALEETPRQLPVLAASGVVDAGGAGLVLLLDALRAVVAGEGPAPSRVPAPSGGSSSAAAAPGAACPATDHGFEVMYLLDADEPSVRSLRARLSTLGGSLVVVGGDGLWNVHVHTDDPGAAMEAGIEAGRPHQVRITHLLTGTPLAHAAAPTPGPRRDEPVGPQVGATGCAVVAFAAGAGLKRLFEDAGATAVTPTAAHRVSTGEVLEAVRAAGAGHVVVLPNDPDTLVVARAAAELAGEEGLHVTVLPTRAQVQGLAALAVHQPGRDPADDVAAMAAGAAATRHGAVTVAARDATTPAGPCRAGDALGAVDGDLAVVGDDLVDVGEDVVTRLLSGGGDLVTLVLGADADDGLADAVRDRVRSLRPDVEVQVLDGGQAGYPLLVGVE